MVLPVTLGLFIFLSSGMREASIEDDFYKIQVVKPRSRLSREVRYYSNRVNDGYVVGTEILFAAATRGGKNVLSRKSLKQIWGFMRDLRLFDLAIEHRGTRISGRDVLNFQPPTPQPYRFIVLDCWQEGDFDFYGTVANIVPPMVSSVADIQTTLDPFLADDVEVEPNPYSW